MRIEQNKNTFLILGLILALILSLVTSAYADDNLLSSQPLSPCIYVDQKGTGGIGNISFDSSNNPCYGFFCLYQQCRTAFFCSENPDTVIEFSRYSTNGSFIDKSSCSLASFDSSTSLYYCIGPGNTKTNDTFDWFLPYYSTLSDGLLAVRDLIDNPPSSATVYNLNYSLPAGNVAYIKLDSSATRAVLNTRMPVISYLFGSWPNVTQKYGFSSNLPNSNTTFPLSGWTTVDWSKAAPFNILGQSYNACDILPLSSNTNYLIIYNPLYYYERDGGNGVESKFHDNGSIQIDIDGVTDIKVYGLTSSATIGPHPSVDDAITSVNDNNSWSGTYNPETNTIEWEDQNGDVSSPSVGGGNIGSNPTTINDFLQNIANQISSFFTGAVGAVSTLISAASQFFQSLSGLYTWLPSPVYSVLISALIIAVTIGVIKVFI